MVVATAPVAPTVSIVVVAAVIGVGLLGLLWGRDRLLKVGFIFNSAVFIVSPLELSLSDGVLGFRELQLFPGVLSLLLLNIGVVKERLKVFETL